MRTIRTLAAAWIAATALLLALAGGAWAALPNISTSNPTMQIYTDGAGRVDFNGRGPAANANSGFYNPGDVTTTDAGLNIAIYNADNTTTVYGFRGTPFTPDLTGQQGFKSGSGTIGAPYKLESDYLTACPGTRCLHIHETLSYVTGTYTWHAKYDVTNGSLAPIRYRATVGANVIAGSSYSSRGWGFKDTPGGQPRSIGTVNKADGTGIALVESLTSPWWGFQEDERFQVFRNIDAPASAGLPAAGSAHDTSPVDSALAAQWDDHATVGNELQSNAPAATYEVDWRLFDWDPLALSLPQAGNRATDGQATPGNAASAGTGSAAQASATYTALERDGSTATNIDENGSTPLRWRICGLNPDPSVNGFCSSSAYNTAAQTTPGQANVTWSASSRRAEAGEDDTIYGFVDLDGDGLPEAYEPQASNTVTWFDRLRNWDTKCVVWATTCTHYTGEATTLRIETTDFLEVGAQKNVWYQLIAPAGGNGIIGTAAQTGLNGRLDIPWTPTGAGTYTFVVRTDLNGDDAAAVDASDFGEQQTFTINVNNRVRLYPPASNAEVDLASPAQPSTQIDPDSYGELDPGSYYYKVTARSTYDYYDYYYETGETTPSPASGAATVDTYGDVVQLDWPDVPGANGYYVYRADSPGGPYEYLSTSYSSAFYDDGYDYPDSSRTAPTTNTTGQRTIEAQLLDSLGDPDNGQVLRYWMSGANWIAGANPVSTANVGVPTDPTSDVSNCQYYYDSCVQIPVNATLAGKPKMDPGRDTIHVYRDLNANQAYDPGEPIATARIDWVGIDATTNAAVDRVVIPQSSYSRTVSLSQQDVLTATAKDDAGNPVPNKQLAWQVTQGPDAGTVHYQSTDSQGHLTISFANDTATTSGTDDYINVWDDEDTNGTLDDAEASDSASVRWHDPIEIDPPTESDYVSQTFTGDIHFWSPTGTELTGANRPAFTWDVTGLNDGVSGSDANPGPCPQYSSYEICYVGTALPVNSSTDTIEADASMDTDGDSNTPPVPVSAEATVTWLNRLTLSPITQNKSVGQTATITPCLRNDSRVNRVYHYTVAGANADATVKQAQSDSSGPCSSVSILLTATKGGTDTVTVSTRAAAGSGPDDTFSSATINWNRLKLIPDKPDGSFGTARTVTATLYDNNGVPVPGEVIRWTRNSSWNPSVGKPAQLTDNNGNVAVTWTGAYPGSNYCSYSNGYTDDIDAYADLNHDGIQQPSEPSGTTSVKFWPRIGTDKGCGETKWRGTTETVQVTSYDADHVALPNQQLKYVITGVNPTPEAQPLPLTDSNGRVNLSWVGGEAGNDVLTVFKDGNDNGKPDSGEAQTNTTINWKERLTLTATGLTTNRPVQTASPAVVSATLKDTSQDANYYSGLPEANTVLRWSVTGANPNAGGTVTTNGSGQVSSTTSSGIFWPAVNAGTDVLTVYADENNDGTRQLTEPRKTLTILWKGGIALAHSPSTKTVDWVGATHTVVATLDPTAAAGSHKIHWSISGSNAASCDSNNSCPSLSPGQSTNIQWTGNTPGLDTLTVWADLDNSNSQTAADSTAIIQTTWKPLLEVTYPSGTHTAGNAVDVTATLVNTSGAGVAGQVLNYTVTGANPATGTTPATAADGTTTFTLDSVDPGNGTITVDDGVGGHVGTIQITWAPPPAVITLTPAAASKYAGNTQTVTAKVTGMVIPAGGLPVWYRITGVNTVAWTQVQTDNNGVVQFNWNDAVDTYGTDRVEAFADTNQDATGPSPVANGYDPSTTLDVTWLSRVVLSSTATGDQATGTDHTETVTLLDGAGAPLPAGQTVLYKITGANPTAGAGYLARPIGSSPTSTFHARTTDGTGSVQITWTGINAGTDTLTAFNDANANGVPDSTEAINTRQIVWATPSSGGGSSGPSTVTSPTGTPIAAPSANPPQTTLPPGSDLDGLAEPPPPVVAKKVNVAPVKGKVFVKVPGAKKYVELVDAEQIPVGSIVDVRKGTVALTSAQDLKSQKTATAQFYAGQFQIAQKKATKPITDLNLYGGSFKPCAKISKKSRKSSADLSQKKKIRELWGKGTGLFRTKGKYAAASVRGTNWDVVDYCDGTLVKVAQGIVNVEPKKGKARILKAPKSLFVPVAGLAKKK